LTTGVKTSSFQKLEVVGVCVCTRGFGVAKNLVIAKLKRVERA